MPDLERFLIEILARSDAAWYPVRDFSIMAGDFLSINAMLARTAPASRGIAYASGKTSDAGRKQAERMLTIAVKAGAVIAHKSRSKTRTTSIKLTMCGERLARSRVGMKNASQSLDLLAKVNTLTRRPPVLLTDCWIDERRVAESFDATERDLGFLEEDIVALLAHRLIDSAATTARHVLYSVTPAGRKLLESGAKAETWTDGLYSDVARRVYFDELRIALDRLAGTEPEDLSEIGLIPLPAAFEGVPLAA